MMHPDHFRLVCILLMAGITACIGEQAIKLIIHLWR
jgi:hypothetical protein